MEIKKVMTKKGTGRKIAKLFGVTEVTVSNAVRGNINSELARKIRYVAVKEYGGVAIYE